MRKTKINVLTLLPKEQEENFKKFTTDWDKYFEINKFFDEPKNLSKYLDKNINILFIWTKETHEFKLEYYKNFQEKISQFIYVGIQDKPNEKDFIKFKMLMDDMVYLNREKTTSWKLLAILRRYWNSFSKSSTIIHRDIIADFVDGNITVEGVKVDLTKKETQLLRLFTKNIGKYLPKNEIFKSVWGYEIDSSRTLDQMIFKLKRKIGPQYFHFERSKGYRFE